MTIDSASAFLQDISNHADVSARAATSDLGGMVELASELGHDDITAEDLVAAAEALGDGAEGSDDVVGFTFGGQILSTAGMDFGMPTMGLGKSKPSSSTHGPSQRKWPRPGCDCDTD